MHFPRRQRRRRHHRERRGERSASSAPRRSAGQAKRARVQAPLTGSGGHGRFEILEGGDRRVREASRTHEQVGQPGPVAGLSRRKRRSLVGRRSSNVDCRRKRPQWPTTPTTSPPGIAPDVRRVAGQLPHAAKRSANSAVDTRAPVALIAWSSHGSGAERLVSQPHRHQRRVSPGERGDVQIGVGNVAANARTVASSMSPRRYRPSFDARKTGHAGLLVAAAMVVSASCTPSTPSRVCGVSSWRAGTKRTFQPSRRRTTQPVSAAAAALTSASVKLPTPTVYSSSSSGRSSRSELFLAGRTIKKDEHCGIGGDLTDQRPDIAPAERPAEVEVSEHRWQMPHDLHRHGEVVVPEPRELMVERSLRAEQASHPALKRLHVLLPSRLPVRPVVPKFQSAHAEASSARPADAGSTSRSIVAATPSDSSTSSSPGARPHVARRARKATCSRVELNCITP